MLGCARANALELAIDGEMDGRATLGIWQISIYLEGRDDDAAVELEDREDRPMIP
jgi:hypothetical protein